MCGLRFMFRQGQREESIRYGRLQIWCQKSKDQPSLKKMISLIVYIAHHYNLSLL